MTSAPGRLAAPALAGLIRDQLGDEARILPAHPVPLFRDDGPASYGPLTR